MAAPQCNQQRTDSPTPGLASCKAKHDPVILAWHTADPVQMLYNLDKTLNAQWLTFANVYRSQRRDNKELDKWQENFAKLWWCTLIFHEDTWKCHKRKQFQISLFQIPSLSCGWCARGCQSVWRTCRMTPAATGQDRRESVASLPIFRLRPAGWPQWCPCCALTLLCWHKTLQFTWCSKKLKLFVEIENTNHEGQIQPSTLQVFEGNSMYAIGRGPQSSISGKSCTFSGWQNLFLMLWAL